MLLKKISVLRGDAPRKKVMFSILVAPGYFEQMFTWKSDALLIKLLLDFPNRYLILFPSFYVTKLDVLSFNTLLLDFQNRYFILFPRFLGVFRKEMVPGFEPEISSPGKKEQIFGKNPPAAALG